MSLANRSLTGTENEEWTQNIICCKEPDGSGPNVDDETRIVDELSKVEELILDTMHPVWFSRKHGYHGKYE